MRPRSVATRRPDVFHRCRESVALFERCDAGILWRYVHVRTHAVHGNAVVESLVSRESASRTDDGAERTRYEIEMDLQVKHFHKQVLVTLNDRHELTHPMLIGRNILRHAIVVDVGLDVDTDN